MTNEGDVQVKYAKEGEYPCTGCPDTSTDGGKCIHEEKCKAWKIFSKGEANGDK